MRTPVIGILAVLSTATALHAAVMQNFYVDPVAGNDVNDGKSTTQAYKTIPAAQAAVRTLTAAMTGDIVVNLKGGLHTLTDSLKFGAADGGSGANIVVYQSYPGERAIISGGRTITGWSLDAATGFYKATVGTTITSRNFFVNGNRCARAASEFFCNVESPDVTLCPFFFSDDNGGFVYLPGTGPYSTMSSWGNIKDVEFSMSSNWQNHRVRIDNISGSSAVLVQPGGAYASRSTGPITNVFQVENAFELLDMPGEWYLNRTTGVLWYQARPGEEMSRATAILADLPTAINVNGAQNLKFSALQFSYFDFKRIANPNNWCYVGRFASGWMDYPGWAMNSPQWQETHVWLENSKNVTFDRNIFTHLGSYAIRSNKANTNITVTGNVFTDLGGGGVSFGAGYGATAAMSDSNVVCTNNYFAQFATDFYDDVAIYVNNVRGSLFANNEIYGAPYAGFLCRGTSNGQANAALVSGLVARNNRIIGYTCNPLLKDGGSFYLCGSQSGGNVQENFVQRGAYAALYCDVAAANINLTRNVVEGMMDYLEMEFQNANRWAMVWESHCHDVVFDGNFTNWNTQENTSTGANCVIRNTTYESAPLWPLTQWSNSTAQGVVARSGLEATYADIRPNYGTNVALGKTVTASSSEETAAWSRNFLVDGKTISSTSSAVGFSCAGTGWVQVDLGSSCPINRIVLWPRQDFGVGNRAGAAYPRDFKIDISTDGSAWATIVEEAGAKKSDFYGTAYSLTPVNARYVKLTCTKVRDEFGVGARMQLGEMEVYSDNSVPVMQSMPGVRRVSPDIRVTAHNGVWTVSNPGLVPASVTIHDMAGRQVASARTGKAAVVTIHGNSRGQAAGNYCVRIRAQGSTITRKVAAVQ